MSDVMIVVNFNLRTSVLVIEMNQNRNVQVCLVNPFIRHYRS